VRGRIALRARLLLPPMPGRRAPVSVARHRRKR
jgi:hypothetical protein